VKLLRSIGITITGPSSRAAAGGTLFFTNAVLCLKAGGMQARVMPEWFTNCGFAVSQTDYRLGNA
jgi:hypothetical protein